MDLIHKKYIETKKLYDTGHNSLHSILDLISLCLTRLENKADIRDFGHFFGSPNVHYQVAQSQDSLSRPFRNEFFIQDHEEFKIQWNAFLTDLKEDNVDDPDFQVLANKIIYTSISSFSLVYDIWKPKSRKTPGTFFEVFMGSLFRLHMPEIGLSKHIKLPVDDGGETESVSTDLVLMCSETGKAAVLPLKITTRERIVQPFAHQRILDSAYPDKYQSFLICISEVQRDDKTQSVKQVCVPGTIKLFQKHLGNMSGIYYCDVPQRYAKEDLSKIIDVKNVGSVFQDIKKHLQ